MHAAVPAMSADEIDRVVASVSAPIFCGDVPEELAAAYLRSFRTVCAGFVMAWELGQSEEQDETPAS